MVANKQALFVTLVDHVPRFETLKPVFHQIRCTYMSHSGTCTYRSQDNNIMAIFVLTTTTMPDDTTNYFTLMHVRGVKISNCLKSS